MIRLKIKNSYYQIIDGYDVRESSREVKFSSLTIDFTNKTLADLPFKYQEVQLLKLDDNYNVEEVIYTGYINNFTLPKMKNGQEFRELELDLLSPLALATVRTVDAVGTYNLQPLVKEIIQPLIDDGFVLKEFNISNNQITVNYLTETVESALNKLSNKFNIWWYIDENKNIYINSISYLLAKNPKITYDDNNKIDGLIDVIPSISSIDYCNTVEFTNLRLYVESFFYRYTIYDSDMHERIEYKYLHPIKNIKTIKSGQEIIFDIPIDISLSGCIKNKYKRVEYQNMEVFYISGFDSSNNYTHAYIYLDENNEFVISSNITLDNSYSDVNTWVLVRDVFFNNLIVGLKYNGTNDLTIAQINSRNGLMWAKLRVIDDEEVHRNKGIISNTGIVEKQVNMNEQWKNYDEMLEIADSYIRRNDTKVEQVRLNVDKETGLNIGDTIKINKPSFLIDDIYIITDKNTSYYNNIKKTSFTLKNTSILESYVDLFRASEQEQEDKEYTLITANYSKDNIAESYEVSVNES